MTSKAQNSIRLSKMVQARTWGIVAVAVVGMVAYHYTSNPASALHKAGGMASIQPAHVNMKAAAQVENSRAENSGAGSTDVAVNTGSKSTTFKFKGNSEVGQVSRHKPAQSGKADASASAANVAGGSGLFAEAIRSSRARAHKLAARQRPGVTIKQYSARLNYQVAAVRQQLQLARNQLSQLQVGLHAAKGKTLSKAAHPSQATITGLKNRIRQMELSLSARQRLLQQSQQQLARA